MIICLFEDFHRVDPRPLSHCRPFFDLRCGIFTVLERTAVHFPGATIQAAVRPLLRDFTREHYGVSAPTAPDLYINASALIEADTAATIRTFAERDMVFLSENGEVIAVSARSESFRAFALDAVRNGAIETFVGKTESLACDAKVVMRAWDLVRHNSAMLVADAQRFLPGCRSESARVSASVDLIGTRMISIGPGASIASGVVIDASDGPVVIDEDAQIMPQAVIIGPAYIGKGSRIKVAAKIYEGTSIGPVCKVGGEVEESVFHSYANKQHDGFLGHSYLSPWTNLGADTNTSDLKNTYSPVSMSIEGVEQNTGMQFLGIIMGDHSKTAINTMFNTGTCVGVGCNVFGAGFPEKFLPSFTWGGSDGLAEYDFERFLATARIVMRRRNIEPAESEIALLRHVFQTTAQQREQFH